MYMIRGVTGIFLLILPLISGHIIRTNDLFILYCLSSTNCWQQVQTVKLPVFFFHRQITDEHRRRSLEEESVWLRIRSLTLRLLASLAALGHTQQNSEVANENGVGDKTSVLGSLLAQLSQTLQTAAQMAEKHTQVSCARFVWSVSFQMKSVVILYRISQLI